MSNPSKPRQSSEQPGLRSTAWAAGAGLLMVACCAVPALIATGVAAGALGAVGVWVSNPWVIGAAVVLMLVVVRGLARRVTRHGSSGPGTGSSHERCAPTSDQPPHPGTGGEED